MKALIISNLEKRFLPGHHSMIDPLEELGYVVTWASNFSEYKDDLSCAPCKTVQIDFERNPFNLKNIKAYKQLMELLINIKYDVIHCNSPIGGVLGRLCGNKVKVPKIIYTAHGFHFYKGAPFINRTLFKWAEMCMAHYTDAIITINQEDYEAALKFRLRKDGKVYYVPGIGIDTLTIKEANPKREEIIKCIGADNNSILLLSVGELNKNKNNKVIIEALGKLKNPKIHYLLCGIGEMKAYLIDLAKKNNIEKNIHFLGYRADIPQLLKSVDIFVMPSYREGLSRSLMEAMAAGLPCVVSKIRGNVDLIEENKGGFLRYPNDIEGLTDAIKTLADDKDLRISMGKYNLAIIRKYDVENIKKKMKKIYYNVLGEVENEKN